MRNILNYEHLSELNQTIDLLLKDIEECKEISKARIGEFIDLGRLDDLTAEKEIIQYVVRLENALKHAINDPLDNYNESDLPPSSELTLEDNLTNKKPYAYTFLEDEKLIGSWRSFIENLCAELYNYNPEKFNETIDNRVLNGTHAKYFSYDMNEIKNPSIIKQDDGLPDIYIDTARLSSNGFLFAKKLIKFFDFEISDVKIRLDHTFSRKKRITNKKEAS